MMKFQTGRRLGLSGDLLQGLWHHLGEPHTTSLLSYQNRPNMSCEPFTQTRIFIFLDKAMSARPWLVRDRVTALPTSSSRIFGRDFSTTFKANFDIKGLESTVPSGDDFDSFAIKDWACVAQSGFLGPTWMDDLCLESKAGQCASLLLSTCRAFPMTPNLKPGKAEILLYLYVVMALNSSKRSTSGPTLCIRCRLLTETRCIPFRLSAATVT